MTTPRAGAAATDPQTTKDPRRVSADGGTSRPSAATASASFTLLGISHAEALARSVPETSQLVDGLIEVGTVGELSGLPETYKSNVANEIGTKVADGRGRVFGRFDVVRGGPVGYVWQDDSEANELRRLQAYSHRHGHTGALPIRWYLNEGLRLPEHVDELRAVVTRDGLVLLVLDSLYNIASGDLKDEAVGSLYRTLKGSICDETGCAILVVDHSPWPTDGNKGQRRAYGSVFKRAAVRWWINLERAGDTIYVEAGGNNVPGVKRTPAIWDPDSLELRIVGTSIAEQDLGARLADFLTRNRGVTTSFIEAGVQGKATDIRSLLQTDARFESVPAVLFGKPKNAKCWARSEDAAQLIRDNFTNVVPAGDDVGTRSVAGTPRTDVVVSPSLRSRGDDVADDLAVVVPGRDDRDIDGTGNQEGATT